MKVAFNDVRNEVANLNSFVQERISGIKEIQIFNREKIENEKFIKINEKHKNAWLKTVWYNSIFFPIAEISISISVGLIVWYAGSNIIQLENFVSLGTIFLFIQLSQMLFRPLRQIADKFNTLQMGMVAAKRVFEILDSDYNIIDKGPIKNEEINGDIKFEKVLKIAKKITPVPGGVGPMTIACLMHNTVKAAYINKKNNFINVLEGIL